MPTTVQHPSAATLAAFAGGTLNDLDAERVATHLDTCPDCTAAADGPSDDALVTRLRGMNSPPEVAGGADPAPSPTAMAWPRLPRFEILGELGRGGAGVVYQALQPALGRTVALKLMRDGWDDAEDLRRFRAEGQAVAGLNHPNVVAVYEVGEHGGRPYLALEFVDGGSLRQRTAGVIQPPRVAARLVETLARAVQAVHGLGIVHRDLKPANVLVTADGVPKVADFGLARRLDATLRLTQTGAVVGTPEYMSPEQARGEPAGPGADIHGLGVILYEVLAGRPPFAGDTPTSVMMRVAADPPASLRRAVPGLPADLETICLKCLEKEPERRYASAGALADDLGRFLADEPIRARPPKPWERLAKWARRRPAVAALSAAVVLTTLVGFGLVTWQWRRAEDRAEGERIATGLAEQRAEGERRARSAERDARLAADQQRKRAERAALEAAVDQALNMCETGDLGRGLTLLVSALERCTPETGDLEHAIRLNLAAWRGYHAVPVSKWRQGASITAAAFSPDGKLFLTANVGNTFGKAGPAQAQLFDVAREEKVGPPATHNAPIFAVAFAPDGKSFATASFDRTVRLWDTATVQPMGEPLRHPGRLRCVVFSPDGKRLAAGGAAEDAQGRLVAGAQLHIWDLESRGVRSVPLPQPGIVLSVDWSPDGRRVATGSAVVGREGVAGGEARLWDPATGNPIGDAMRHNDVVAAVAFNPDGSRLATGCADRMVRFWSAERCRPDGPVIIHPQPVTSLAFSRDGRTLATACGNGPPGDNYGDARLWDAETGRPLTRPLAHLSDSDWNQMSLVHAVALSADGRHLLTGCRDGRHRLWDVSDAWRPAVVLRPDAPLWAVEFLPGGTRLLTVTRKPDSPRSVARVWDLATNSPVGQPMPHADLVVGHSVSADGAGLLTWGADKVLRRWNLADGTAVALPDEMSRGAVSASFDPAGARILVGYSDGTARLWNARDNSAAGEPVTHGEGVTKVLFGPDGRTYLTIGGAAARRWSTSGGGPVGEPMRHAGEVVSAVFRPDGILLTTSRDPVETRSWNADDGAPRGPAARLTAADLYTILSPDGSLVLTVPPGARPHDGVRFWDPLTGRPKGSPAPDTRAAAFHPTSRIMATVGAGQSRLWSMDAARPAGPSLPQGAGGAACVAIGADGRLLAVGGADGTVRIWPMPAPVSGTPVEVGKRIEALTGVSIDGHGVVRLLGDDEAWKLRRALPPGQ